ncbi:spore germination protein [Paenibacillus chartarius]|uniref:Spore germination protein n=1 Tax=Paenibacillus chartarius TaxID=747481 RepID=A0ABV6DH78_9BACL
MMKFEGARMGTYTASSKVWLTSSLQDNTDYLLNEFADCSDAVFRDLTFADNLQGVLVYFDGIVKTEELNNSVLQPLLLHYRELSSEQPDVKDMEERLITLSETSRVRTLEDLVDRVLEGNAVLLLDGFNEALVLHVAGATRRSVQEPQSEAVVRGPREGFVESIQTNVALVRLRIRSSKLKMVQYVIGEETKTTVMLAYMEGIAKPDVIDEVKRRLASIKIDGILESGYIEELIEDNPYSPFPQLRHSERPDTVASQLLEGKFAIFTEGTPFVLKGPTNLWQMIQANEDYYERYLIGTLLRILRYFLMTVALLLPSLYIATTTFHQDMLPTTLLQSIAAAREAIPFPALIEALIMEIAFEALREAGVRLPKTVGQAVSILGALVIGQAAVQAGIVSAPMVMIVSMTGIASFTIPHFNFAISVRMLRFPLMFLAGILGLFGIVAGIYLIGLHLVMLRSFGQPYLTGFAPYRKHESKDMVVRVPWWRMKLRPSTSQRSNKQRQEPDYQG